MANKRSDEEPMISRTFVSAFARGLAAIEAFGPENRTMTVAEMADNLGVDRAVARRLLLTSPTWLRSRPQPPVRVDHKSAAVSLLISCIKRTRHLRATYS